jgi:hypothetical protein
LEVVEWAHGEAGQDTRGLLLQQKVGTGGTIGGVSTERYDDDVTLADKLGGAAVWLTLNPQ